MYSCPKCRLDVPPGTRFCLFCGARISSPDADAPRVDPLIGQTFRGVYLVQRRIGGGGMGDVYKAMHLTLEVPVALKVLKKALLADRTMVARFHQAARAASRLHHRNVTAVTDFGQTDDGTLYMAMEYVSGKSLARVIAEEQPLSERRIVRIGEQILSALAEAHATRILHRDLKPENVMLESRRNELDAVKVLDFGIAKLQPKGDHEAGLTAAGLVCGTPGYMSPEQRRGERLDARSDLYAVGVILYEMLTGKLPHDPTARTGMARGQAATRPARPSVHRGGQPVCPELEALVMRALASNRDERAASAEVMRGELLSCALLPTATIENDPPHTGKTTVRHGRPPPRRCVTRHSTGTGHAAARDARARTGCRAASSVAATEHVDAAPRATPRSAAARRPTSGPGERRQDPEGSRRGPRAPADEWPSPSRAPRERVARPGAAVSALSVFAAVGAS